MHRDTRLGGVEPLDSLDGIVSTGGRINALNSLKMIGMMVTSMKNSNRIARVRVDARCSMRYLFYVCFEYPA